MAMPYTPTVTGTGARATIQRFGGYLAGMVMPNIARVHRLGPDHRPVHPDRLVAERDHRRRSSARSSSMLLPVLIGYTGGRLVHGQRGAVVGAVATMGVVVGADIPMFLGAMIIGPLTAFILKLFDGLIAGPDPARLRDAGRQLQRRHHRRRHGDRSASTASARSSTGSPTGRQRRQLPGRPQPAAARRRS